MTSAHCDWVAIAMRRFSGRAPSKRNSFMYDTEVGYRHFFTSKTDLLARQIGDASSISKLKIFLSTAYLRLKGKRLDAQMLSASSNSKLEIAPWCWSISTIRHLRAPRAL